MKTRRISARVSAAVAAKLEDLAQQRGSSVSEAIAAAVESSYAQLCGNTRRSQEIFRRTRFVGCGADSPSLSKRYKSLLKKTLVRKA